jgi:subtilase family serine protease
MQRKFGINCLLVVGVMAMLILPRQTAALISAAPSPDATAANPGATVSRVILLLKPTAAQDSALDELLLSQQTKGSAQYHQWLTSTAFAQNYSLDAASTQQVVLWLKSRNFNVAPLPTGGSWIEFSGTVTALQSAFGAQLSYSSGSTQLAASSLTISDEIAPYVLGIASLDGVLAHPAIAKLGTVSLANTSGLLTPASITSRYNLAAPQGTDGTGVTIAIPSRSNLDVTEVAGFRSNFGLSPNAVQVHTAGADPGISAASNPDVQEALLDAAWAGVAAPNASVLVVPAATTAATDGLDLALGAIVDQHLADVVSVSYLSCEDALSDAHRAFYRALYRQAAAEGITVIAATGDNGASACSASGTGSVGYSVNALAATPWNIAVGGTALLAGNVESGWQATSTTSNSAGGGGISHFYATPSWQTAAGVLLSDPDTTAAHHRYLPDISLAATDAVGGYAFCTSDCADGILSHATGTSGATALFAGIFAQVVQKYGTQGAAAQVLYELNRIAGVYNDVTVGSAKTFCAAGSAGCGADGLLGYSAAIGFDLATGLGSVNAQDFVSNFGNASPLAGSNTAIITINTAAQNIYANQEFTVSVSATSSTLTGPVPTGTIILYDQLNSGSVVGSATLNASGTASVSILAGVLSVGPHSLVAQYNGDTNYAAAISSPVQINVSLVSTTTTAAITTTTIQYGSPTIATATVTPQATIPQLPSGAVTFKVDGVSAGTGSLATSGTTYTTAVQLSPVSVGSHTLVATYAGDTNYATSSSASANFLVGKGISVTTITSTPSVLVTGSPATFTATISVPATSTITSPVFTGTVQFMDGTTLLGTPVTVASNTATSTAITLASGSTHSITAVYSGDTNWLTSTSSALVPTASSILTTTITLTSNVSKLYSASILILTATVTPTTFSNSTINPTGKVIFYDGTQVVGAVSMAASTLYNSVAVLTLSSLTPGPHEYTAVYLGDTSYSGSTSNVLPIQVQDFTITAGAISIDIPRGGTGAVTFTVTGYGGYNDAIEITCAAPANTYITCFFTPNVLYGSGTTTLNIVTSGTSTAQLHPAPNPFLRAAGGVALASLIGVLMLPVFKCRRQMRNLAACLLLLAGLIATVTGCSNTEGVVPVTAAQTPLGVETLTITAAAVVDNTTVSHRVYLPVNVQ